MVRKLPADTRETAPRTRVAQKSVNKAVHGNAELAML